MKFKKNSKIKLALLSLIIIGIGSYIYDSPDWISPLTGQVVSEIIYENGSIEKLLFCPKDNCTSTLVDIIEKSEDVKCVFYDLDLPKVIDVLIKKDAKVYMEEDNKLNEFHYGNSPALMHNKFCIFDGKTIATGSFNPTNRGANYNNNNLIIINSKTLANNYLDEFEEIKNKQYGKGSKVKNSQISLNGLLIENYFCPEDNCKNELIKELNNAKNNITFMTFSFTDKDISDLLILKSNQGLNVMGVMEGQRTNMQYNVFKYLDGKIEVHKDINKYNMHHKVFIIDGKTVVTGSYNPTGAGNTKNDENMIIIHNENIAKKYLEEYKTLY